MSLKYTKTTADYLQWDEAMNLIRKLAKDGNMSRYGLEIEDISNDNYKILNEYLTKEMKNIWSNKMKKYSTLKLHLLPFYSV